ncbi:uncharacterized protein LOC122382034 [Amphibalanus amphitrite]|uniref:uncharacterized protein LOC122382034 n=1 Tax=Amphibalanus amphitrite TaxID=1232801 RepID=UPI001C92ABF8|nr:uncharacterized protein LOC122382034 [Amphibalanus amphitrite]
MPLFQLAVCAIWREHEGSLKKSTSPLTLSSKPAGYLHLQYDLLPSAFYKTCSVSLINWGRVAKLVTGDGSSSALAPIVHGHNVSAMVALLEHPIAVNQDGMLDLLHHKVNVTVTEAKEAVPSAMRTKRPGHMEMVGAECGGAAPSADQVTLTTPIAERAAEEEPAGEEARPLPLEPREKGRGSSADVSVSSTVASDEPPTGLALPIAAGFGAVGDELCQRHFTPLVAEAERLVTPVPEQISSPKTKGDKRESNKGKSQSKKKAKSGDKRQQGDKKAADSARGKKDKNELVLTFNMDFFFSGTLQLTASSALCVDSPGLVQVALVLRAPAFLAARQRLALNPLVVHLRGLDGLPALPTGFAMAAGERQESETPPPPAEEADGGEEASTAGAEAARRPPVFFAAVHMPDGEVYCSPDQDYAHQVTLNELSVVFCGLLEREALWERLQTVPLRIELLWRHTTPLVSNKRFNQMEIDRYIHQPNLVNIIKQSGNPFALPNPLPTKFAEVLVDVSALTRGVRLLSVEVPLTAVPAGPAASPAADIERGTCPPPFGPLQLLQSAAQLSVSVSLAVPLDLLPRPAPARCAYGRLLAVVSQRGLQRSGVLQLIQQLNEPPSPAAAEGAAPRRPGDVSTPGISGFCLADRQLHLLFAEGRADAELEQVAAALRALPRRDARLCHHSGLLFGERLYARRPAAFRVLEGRPLRARLLETRLYTSQKQEEPARAVRAIGECFRTQWLSDTLKMNLLPSEAGLLSLQQLLAG